MIRILKATETSPHHPATKSMLQRYTTFVLSLVTLTLLSWGSASAQGTCNANSHIPDLPCSSHEECWRCQYDAASCTTDGDCTGICQSGLNECTDDSECTLYGVCEARLCINQASGAACEGLTLPVELTSFEAAASGSTVVLSWTTGSETDNAGFEIERRVNDESEDAPVWKRINFVEGHGTTDASRQYVYRVENLSVGTHLFRLKQVDFDGAFEYSPEVEAAVAVPGQYMLEPAYPNPFNPTTTIRFAVATQQSVVVTLYDASGRIAQELYRGQPTPNETQSIRIDAGGLASGQYQVRVQGETFTASERVTLVK